jgi:hypothetical protein
VAVRRGGFDARVDERQRVENPRELRGFEPVNRGGQALRLGMSAGILPGRCQQPVSEGPQPSGGT